jgi:molecular chaperone GrpE (heat shock protein)
MATQKTSNKGRHNIKVEQKDDQKAEQKVEEKVEEKVDQPKEVPTDNISVVLEKMRRDLDQTNTRCARLEKKCERLEVENKDIKEQINVIKADFVANFNRVDSDLRKLRKFNSKVIFRELIVDLRLKAINHLFRKDQNQTEFESWQEFIQFANADERREEMISRVGDFIIDRGIDWRKCIELLGEFNNIVHEHTASQISEALESDYEDEGLKSLIQQVKHLLDNFPPRVSGPEEH